MKFIVTSRIASGSADTPLPESQAITKDVKVVNSKATLLNLRAVIAFKFRIALYSFAILYHGNRSSVDLTDEKKTLGDCGLQEGDTLLLWSKRSRLEDAHTVMSAAPPVLSTTRSEHLSKTSRVDVTENVMSEALPDSSVAVVAGDTNIRTGELCSSSSSHDARDLASTTMVSVSEDVRGVSHQRINLVANEPTSAPVPESNSDESAADEDEDDRVVSRNQHGAVTQEEAGEAAGGGPEQLYERLMEVVPNLVEMRQQFLADPQAILQRIEQSDSRLFSLITANQEAFLELVNNEETVRLLQAEKDDTWDDDDDDEDDYSEAEFDEEDMEFGENLEGDDDDEEISEATMQAISSIFMRRLNAAMSGQAGAVEASDTVDSGDEDNHTRENSTNTARAYSGSMPLNDREAILAYVPSVEDDRKIEELTQLGFSHEQAKIAFYMCRRSLDRAANYLFESPPQL